MVTWRATRIIPRIPIRHVLDKCGRLKTNKYLLTKSPLVGQNLGLGSRIYRVIDNSVGVHKVGVMVMVRSQKRQNSDHQINIEPRI